MAVTESLVEVQKRINQVAMCNRKMNEYALDDNLYTFWENASRGFASRLETALKGFENDRS